MDVKTIKTWCRRNWRAHTKWSEVNTTTLAETCCDCLSGHDADGSIPDEFFEVAFEVAAEVEKMLAEEDN